MLIVTLVWVQNADKTLLIQEAQPFCRGQWSMPGGRREPGEAIEQAAIREAREEAGVDVRLSGLVHIDQRLRDAGGLPDRLRFVFRAEVIGGDLKHTADEHSLRAAWFTLAEIEALDLRSPVIPRLVQRAAARPALLPLDALSVITDEESAHEQRGRTTY